MGPSGDHSPAIMAFTIPEKLSLCGEVPLTFYNFTSKRLAGKFFMVPSSSSLDCSPSRQPTQLQSLDRSLHCVQSIGFDRALNKTTPTHRVHGLRRESSLSSVQHARTRHGRNIPVTTKKTHNAIPPDAPDALCTICSGITEITTTRKPDLQRCYGLRTTQ